MCGRVAIRHAITEIEQNTGARLVEREVEPVPRFNVGPGQALIVWRADAVRRADGELVHLLWGLIPPWAKTPNAGAGPLVNARAETAAAKPSFRNALRRRRCLVPISGFYEWKRGSNAGRPRPHFFSDPDGHVLFAAGLWEIWHGPAGEILETTCLLTRPAQGVMAGIHDRMPVLVPRNRADEWLDPTLEAAPADLLTSDLAASLACWSVGYEVNSIRNDHPGLIEPAMPIDIRGQDRAKGSPSATDRPDVVENDLFGHAWEDV